MARSRTLGRIWVWGLLLIGLVALGVPGRGQNRSGREENPFAELHFRPIGPVGNRASAVVGEPGNPLVDYVGAASGGIWKTEDGGTTWRPVFDHTDVAAIGALAVAPSAHNIVWAGTGEPWVIRSEYPMGDGVYKSTDAGETWRHMGLDKTGHIARIVIDPRNANRVFVCAQGQWYKPGQQQGIFRTLDGGKTWTRVLFVNDQTGCNDLAMSPNDPNTLFAGMWQVQVRTWNLDSGGPASGVYVTHDGGEHWQKLSGHGLPAANHPLGKVAVAIAPSNPNRVYALMVDTAAPGLYRSDDGGKTWLLVNHSHAMTERSPYYTRFAVSPGNENLLYFPSVSFVISPDGGKTLHATSFFGRRGKSLSGLANQASPGGDNHDVWIDPENPNRILVANDAGASISLNHGRTYQRVVLPIAQMYHVTTDNDIPYHVFSNRQDGSSFRGPSRTLAGGFFSRGIATSNWTATGGCESGFAIPDPKDSNIVWSGCYDGVIDRMDLRTGEERDVSVWPDNTMGWTPRDVKYRWHWTIPTAIDPFDHNRVYVGSQYVDMTTNGGQSWKVISPDLTLNDKSHEGNSGGVTHDNLMTFDGAVLYAIALSPVKPGIIWTGSDDGQVNVTEDGGKHWTNVTKNIPNLPPWGTVWNIEPSHFDAATAYITVNREEVGDYKAYVYKTTDFGKTWTFISGGIPSSMNSSAHCVIEDPVRKGMLYLGTDNALYVSWDDGGHWRQLRNNLPPAPVYWLEIEPRFNDLLVATYGRGIYILDDVTPLRDYDRAATRNFYLFSPRPAYRFHSDSAGRMTDANSHVVGQNPPYGADLNFWLNAPQKKVKITFTGSDGKIIRTLTTKGRPGINRVWWDLRYDSAETAKLRTPPPDNPWVPMGPKGWRPIRSVGVRDPMPGPIVVPGNYTVHVTAGGKTLSAPLAVLPDPHTLGTPQTIRAEVAFLLQMRGEVNEVTAMINHIEWTRKQLDVLQKMLAGQGEKYASVLAAAKKLEGQAIDVEGKLFNIHLTGESEDTNRYRSQLYGRLDVLMGALDGGAGSGPGGASLGPTAQQIEVNNLLKHLIAQSEAEYKQLVDSATPAFNEQLKQAHVGMAIRP